MALLTVQAITTAGLEWTTEAASALGDTFVNDGKTFILVVDEGTEAPVVTVNSLVNCNQGFDHNVEVTVTAGESRMIGPFPTSRFNSSTDLVTVTMDGVTDVKIAAIRL